MSKRLLSLSTTDSPDMQTQEPKHRKGESGPKSLCALNHQYFKFIFPPFEEGEGKRKNQISISLLSFSVWADTQYF